MERWFRLLEAHGSSVLLAHELAQATDLEAADELELNAPICRDCVSNAVFLSFLFSKDVDEADSPFLELIRQVMVGILDGTKEIAVRTGARIEPIVPLLEELFREHRFLSLEFIGYFGQAHVLTAIYWRDRVVVLQSYAENYELRLDVFPKSALPTLGMPGAFPTMEQFFSLLVSIHGGEESAWHRLTHIRPADSRHGPFTKMQFSYRFLKEPDREVVERMVGKAQKLVAGRPKLSAELGALNSALKKL